MVMVMLNVFIAAIAIDVSIVLLLLLSIFVCFFAAMLPWPHLRPSFSSSPPSSHPLALRT
jgi:hypothetical protein